jgi:hypothetical protein
MSLKMFVPATTWAETAPRYFLISHPSSRGVVETRTFWEEVRFIAVRRKSRLEV